MSLVSVRKATAPIRTHVTSEARPSGGFVAKKLPRSQGIVGDKISSNLDDVSFLRLPEVKALTGLSKTTLYTLMRDKSFPAPVRLGTRAVAWLRSEIKQWAEERVHASRSAA